MEIKNFRDYSRTGQTVLNYRYFATVDVTTGYLWWKKTRELRIFRDYTSYWRFMGSGEYCLDSVRNLETAHKAAKNISPDY